MHKWNPRTGTETKALLNYLNLNPESCQVLETETREILSQCGNPSDSVNDNIGLVFGYVQSGKTMSFTTLTAMAKDNGYQMIIVIAGVSTNLVYQSFTRLERDLRIDSPSGWQWLSFKNPKSTDATIRGQIENALRNWKDSEYPEEDRQTILITVMKQKNHLSNLSNLISSLNMENVPVLIIDDEGDQHSMNTQNRKNAKTGQRRMSTIHEKIVDLRYVLPHHTFIQYTATPQGPIFQSIMDDLSPNFIQLLTPGSAYTGGRTFFENESELTEIITDIDPHNSNEPPQSLIRAMQIFYLGVAKGKPNREGKNRSMMIHPSQLTFTHYDYARFVNTIKTNFLDILSMPDENSDKLDLLMEFKNAYDDLATTASDLPPFDELKGNRLKFAISSTPIQSLNSTRNNTTSVQWRNSYSWILIGGQAMDRGFTVEGLTVTYMPRSIGVGNADTIQQRARFFGYKKDYLGYCRIFLDLDAHRVYESYIAHEEDMRSRLLEHKKSGKELNDWYREVFLASGLNLARPNIFSNEFERSFFGGEWNVIKAPHEPQSNIAHNQEVLARFLHNTQFRNDERYPKSIMKLDLFFEQFLNELKFANSDDAGDYMALLYLLRRQLEEEQDEECTVFLISDFEKPRMRTLNERNQINQLFQGRNERREGLRDIRGAGITFQIYVLTLQNDTQSFENIVTMASLIPEEIGEDLIRWK